MVPERTLYQILCVNPLATRQEIKRSYFRLAKLSHPDALIDKADEEPQVDFQEIAEAWKVLGNSKLRKRYDRDLKAKEWSLKAQQYTNERLEQAVPVVADMMDNIAVPFLRRTTATTWAVGQAIATGVSGFSKGVSSKKNSDSRNREHQAEAPVTVNGNSQTDASSVIYRNNDTMTAMGFQNLNNFNGNAQQTPQQQQEQQQPSTASSGIGLTDTFLQALEAGQQAAREIDSLELSEKSSQLQERAQEEAKKGQEIFEQLNEIKEKRLLHTIQSEDITLTASDAQEVLERLHINDSVTIVDRALLRSSIEHEIKSLGEAEEKFTEKLEVYEEVDREWNDLLAKEEAFKKHLSAKKSVEIEARKAFDEAHEHVVDAKKELVHTSNELRGVEEQVRKNAQEMDRITTTLARKQERVRSALKNKTELMQGGIQMQYLSDEDLSALRRKETQLTQESQQIAEMVA
ncbi:MAG: hypothetical protein SGILL_001188, partial [Bacillariaceae sp.]